MFSLILSSPNSLNRTEHNSPVSYPSLSLQSTPKLFAITSRFFKMHFSSSALITSLGFLAAVKAIPAPVSNSESADHGISVTLFYTPDGEIESFKNATDLGVDIYGNIPEDFEEKDGEFFAEPGSKAWTWARAQIDIDWEGLSQEKRDLVEKRQSGSANIGIGMWDRDACKSSPRVIISILVVDVSLC